MNHVEFKTVSWHGETTAWEIYIVKADLLMVWTELNHDVTA